MAWEVTQRRRVANPDAWRGLEAAARAPLAELRARYPQAHIFGHVGFCQSEHVDDVGRLVILTGMTPGELGEKLREELGECDIAQYYPERALGLVLLPNDRW